jgi:NADPH-dependent 2,4-dienoyl-CoA reductase/sulfur reductase-like enzyme
MNCDVLIIGAGPAGLAAAASAAESGAQIHIIDDNFTSGGQIWRGGAQKSRDKRAQKLWENLSELNNVHFHFQSKVIHIRRFVNNHEATIEVVVEGAMTSAGQAAAQKYTAKKIILATGARELLLPFPGWTLPGVTGAGGLQALAKNGYPVLGKRVVLAGSGPLLLAVAASLIERGAIVTHILEQSTLTALSKFAFGLLRTPSKMIQAIKLWTKLRHVQYCSNSYVLAAQGTQELSSARVSLNGQECDLACDFLACGFGLIPNIDLAASLSCELVDTDHYQQVKVNEYQETSQIGVFCAGEGTGVGGVDLSLAEGSIAGYAATAQVEKAKVHLKERSIWRKFASNLHKAFRLRAELRKLCQTDTIVCRCEDVSYGQLEPHPNWRSAKLHTRCGMGACQGRICGAANRFLFSWERDAGRLPLNTAKISSLCSLDQ